MSKEVDETPTGELTAQPELVLDGLHRTRLIGRLADFAASLHEGKVEAAKAATTLIELRDDLHKLTVELTGDRSLDAVRMAPGEFPDIPFYNAILPLEEHRAVTREVNNEVGQEEDGKDNDEVELVIIHDQYLYCPATGEVSHVFGDRLYALNAMLKTRGVFRGPAVHIQYGFRRRATSHATRLGFRLVSGRLNASLASILPDGITPIEESGGGRGYGRKLNDRLIFRDERNNPDYAHLIPDEPEEDLPRPEGKTIAEIVAASGAGDTTVREHLKKLMSNEYKSGHAGAMNIIPDHIADPLIEKLRARRDKMIVSMPEGYCRARPLVLRFCQEMDVQVVVERAIAVWQASGHAPQKAVLQASEAANGGVWVVREEGAWEALVASTLGTRKGRAQPAAEVAGAEEEESVVPGPAEPSQSSAAITEAEPDHEDEQIEAADQEPAAEPQAAEEAEEVTEPTEPLEELGRQNTVADIVAYLNTAEPGGNYTEDEVWAAFNDPAITDRIDPNASQSGVFSYYAANLIAKTARSRRST